MRPSLVLVVGATLLAIPTTAGAIPPRPDPPAKSGAVSPKADPVPPKADPVPPRPGATPPNPGPDSVRYSVAVGSPGPVAVDTVAVRAVVSGGVSQDSAQPRYAAYHVRTLGQWTENERYAMDQVADGVFESSLPTALLPNDRYRLEVRVWGDVPPYDPKDPSTFARAVIDVAVNNPPPAPAGLQAASPSPGLRVGWQAVDTADRADFLGYRVLGRQGRCGSNPSGYEAVGQVKETLFSGRLEPARYCIRVAAVRTSPVSGEILSTPSTPARVVLAPDASAPILEELITASGAPPQPPPPPELPDPNRLFSDARFAGDLPYHEVVTTQAVLPARVRETSNVGPGPDPRQGPMLVALGLILATGSFLVRRFLNVPRP
jgi:hypothetical protein